MTSVCFRRLLLGCWISLCAMAQAHSPLPSDSLGLAIWTDSLLKRAETQAPRSVIDQLSQHWQQAGPQASLAAFYLSYALGECHQYRVQPRAALPWYQRAIALGRQRWAAPTLPLADAYNGQAIVLLQDGRFAEAVQSAQQVLALRRQLLPADHSDLAQAYNNLGIISYQAGRIDSCLAHLAQAARIWEQDPDAPLFDLLTVYNNLGLITTNLGDHQQAIEWFARILPHADSLPPDGAAHQLSLAGVYNNLAQAYRSMEDLAQAILYQRQSLDLSRNQANPDGRAIGIKYHNLGSMFLVLGELDSSLRYYQLALQAKRAALPPDHPLVQDGHHGLARVWLQRDEPQRALPLLEQVLPHYRRLYPAGHPHLASLYVQLGRAHAQLGDTTQGLSWLQQGLAMRQALLAEDHPQVRQLRLELSRWLRYRQPIQAWQHLRHAQPGPEEIHPEAIESRTALGQWHQARRDWPAAWQAYRQALALTDSLWRRYQLSGSQSRLMAKARPARLGALTAAQQLFAQTGEARYLRQAWHLSEQSRALGLREALQGWQAETFGPLPDSLRQAEQTLRRALLQAERQLARAQARDDEAEVAARRQARFDLLTQQDQLMARLAREAPAYYRLRFGRPEIPLARLQAWLGDQACDLIEYFLHEDQGFALLLRPDTLHLVPLPVSQRPEASIEQLRRALFAQGQPVASPTAFVPLARQLFEELVAPVLAVAPDLRPRVVIVPDGALGYLPFGLLLSEAAAPSTPWAGLPYWLREAELSYAYSADWLLHAPPKVPPPQSLLALAPDIEGGQAMVQAVSLRTGRVPLRHHWEEARQVADQVGGEAWLHGAASEAAFKAQAHRYQVLHLSTHAAVDDRFPRYSFLQLAPGSGEDGLLEVAELYRLHLTAELVTLSACETGLGRLRHGDGIVSLGQGFSYAGARSVLMTLWTVNDAASAQLMTDVYARLWQGAGRAEALQQAQLAVLAQQDPILSHPFYWAGFQLSGQPGPLVLATGGLPWGWLGSGLALLALLGYGAYRRSQRKTGSPSGDPAAPETTGGHSSKRN